MTRFVLYLFLIGSVIGQCKVKTLTRQQRQAEVCHPYAVNDGRCDAACNVEEKEWDGGDCCPKTCSPGREFPCGYSGYDCKVKPSTIPTTQSTPTTIPTTTPTTTKTTTPTTTPTTTKTTTPTTTPTTTRTTTPTTTPTTTRTTTPTTTPTTTKPVIPPDWFSATRLCFKWYADGDRGQCGGGVPNHLCASPNQMTVPYRDDTDNRPGGCRMSWGLETSAPNVPDWFRQTSICYRWYPDGDGGQCGDSAPRETCAHLGSYTSVYRDDTDRRPGGCRMSWRLNLPSNADQWAKSIRLCYQWYPDGDGGQCGGGVGRRLCAVAGDWTQHYRDDTDNRGGGCRMQWGLELHL